MAKKCSLPNLLFGFGEQHSVQIRDGYGAAVITAYCVPDGVTLGLESVREVCGKHLCATSASACGEAIALTAESPSAILAGHGVYKLTIDNPDDVDVSSMVVLHDEYSPSAPVCCSCGGGLSVEDVKAVVEACIAPLEARIAANEAAITANTDAIADLTARVSANETCIEDLKSVEEG